MKYTIPYEDKISLPHIKKLLEINIKTGDIYQDNEDLLGKVIVYGEYSLDNSEDIIEFTHEIPVSLLVDDNDIEPKITYSNLEYEVVKGRGVELMFDLDVTLEDRDDDEEFQKEVDQKLNEVLNVRDNITFKDVNDELSVFNLNESEESTEQSEDVVEEVVSRDIEEVEEQSQAQEVANEPTQERKEKVKANVEVNEEEEIENLIIPEEDIVLPDELVEDVEIEAIDNMEYNDFVDELEEEDSIVVSPSDDDTEFDIGFISNINDKYTTYKILILEDGEIIDEILEERELSKELICDEYDYDGRKYVLKIQDE